MAEANGQRLHCWRLLCVVPINALTVCLRLSEPISSDICSALAGRVSGRRVDRWLNAKQQTATIKSMRVKGDLNMTVKGVQGRELLIWNARRTCASVTVTVSVSN